jgi:hypothetical protein
MLVPEGKTLIELSLHESGGVSIVEVPIEIRAPKGLESSKSPPSNLRIGAHTWHESYRILRAALLGCVVPGTSCLATIMLSLRDEIDPRLNFA